MPFLTPHPFTFRYLSKLFLNRLVVLSLTTLAWSLFQLSTTRCVKKCFLRLSPLLFMVVFRPNLIIVPTIVGTGPNLSAKVGASQLYSWDSIVGTVMLGMGPVGGRLLHGVG